MESSFFDESLFDGHLTEIRKRLRKERQDKIASRVLSRLNAQSSVGGDGENSGGMNGVGASGDGACGDGAADINAKMLDNPTDESQAASGAATASAESKETDDESNPGYAEIWQLCSKVCSLLTENMKEAMTEIKKRVDELKTDVEGAASSEAKEEDGKAKENPETDEAGAAAAAAACLESPTTSDKSPDSPTESASECSLTIGSIPSSEAFLALPAAPENHKFHSKPIVPSDPKAFTTALRKELKLMSCSLPDGIFVR